METAHPTPEQLSVMAMEGQWSPRKATGNSDQRCPASCELHLPLSQPCSVDGAFSSETEPFSSLPLAGSLPQFPHLEERMLIDFTLVLLS